MGSIRDWVNEMVWDEDYKRHLKMVQKVAEAREQQMAAQVQAGGYGSIVGVAGVQQTPLTPPIFRQPRPPSPIHMIAMRLHLGEGQLIPFDYIDAYITANKEKVFVFVVKNDKHVTLEDDYTMFPSDHLISQLRLLIG